MNFVIVLVFVGGGRVIRRGFCRRWFIGEGFFRLFIFYFKSE